MTDNEFKQQKWSMDMIPKDILINKIKKLEQALEGIKEIAEKIEDECEYNCFASCAKMAKKQILQKISEVLDD